VIRYRVAYHLLSHFTGGTALANAIPDMGALTALHLSKNSMCDGPGSDSAHALRVALKGNTCLKELDLASNNIKAHQAAILADAIKDMRALTKFDISTNSLNAAGAKALVEGLEGNQVMTELNLAGNELGKAPDGTAAFGTKADMSGIIALADILPGMAGTIGAKFSFELHRTAAASSGLDRSP
jgi:Ran GTPase-activating protein (RanGAP) involved in mRNA processing and transport